MVMGKEFDPAKPEEYVNELRDQAHLTTMTTASAIRETHE